MGQERISHKALWWSCVVSLVLLVVFAWLQVNRSAVMELKAQWLWLAVLPISIALITGKYIGKLKGPGIEFEAYRSNSQMRQLPSTPPQTQPGLAEAPPAVSAEAISSVAKGAPAAPNDVWISSRELEYERTDRLFLVHVYEPSTIPAQKYDITIFLMRHIRGSTPNQRDGFSEVENRTLLWTRLGQQDLHRAQQWRPHRGSYLCMGQFPGYWTCNFQRSSATGNTTQVYRLRDGSNEGGLGVTSPNRGVHMDV